MMDYVWDYGSLEPADEVKYVERMVKLSLRGEEDFRHLELVTHLLVTAQRVARKSEGTAWCVSLRDIARCLRLAKWWAKQLPFLEERPWLKTPQRLQVHDRLYNSIKCLAHKALILALGMCYHCRFPRGDSRHHFQQEISNVFQDKCRTQELPQGGMQPRIFRAVLRVQQEDFLERMRKKPPGTASNSALLENVFVILVSILNRIPVFVVGKPGSSKSLSVQLIRNNVRGKNSDDSFFRGERSFYFFSFQGSTSSTSDGIVKVFEKAEKFVNKDGAVKNDILPVVLLDEIGLADVSPSNPLKVLHKLLEPENGEPPSVGVVGISNWPLDAAKMNRAIYLSRPDPDGDDLEETAKALRDAQLDPNDHLRQDHLSDRTLKCLAAAYHAYQQAQAKSSFAHFHGLRDFYYLVKGLCQMLPEAKKRGDQLSNLDVAAIFETAFQRNFGGLQEGDKNIGDYFFRENDAFPPEIQEARKSGQFKVTVMDRVCDNIMDTNARHLLLITSGDSAMSMLQEILTEKGMPPRVMYGSRFSEDQSEDYSYRTISDIILCMEQGGVLILRDLDRIYGSLYDMLNQGYNLGDSLWFCRVALGPYSNPMCRVDESFRCIVVIDEDRIAEHDPPFLNRFEKQHLTYSTVLVEKSNRLIEELRTWVDLTASIPNYSNQFTAADAFLGYNKDSLPSLVLHHSRGKPIQFEEERTIALCKQTLLCTSPSDAMVRLLRSKLAKKAPAEVARALAIYLEQCHHGLASLVKHQAKLTPDCLHLKLLVLTYVNIPPL